MDRLENRINVSPYRQPSEWTEKLRGALDELGDYAHLGEAERDCVKEFIEHLRLLVYARLVNFFDVVLGNVTCRFNLVYDGEGGDASDEIDVSLLAYGNLDSVPLVLQVSVTDEAYARYLGLDRLESNPVGRIATAIVSTRDHTDFQLKPLPEGFALVEKLAYDGDTLRFRIEVVDGPDQKAPVGSPQSADEAGERVTRTTSENPKAKTRKETADGNAGI
jgi:hypothetical protein